MDSWDDVAQALRDLRTRAGNPSYSEVTSRVRALRADQARPEHVSRTAVYDCFRDGRRRMDLALLGDVAVVLGLDTDAERAWSEACFAVQNRVGAAQIVAVTPPPRPGGDFVGRARETARAAAHDTGLVAITGMAGIGKTRLATQAAHLRVREARSERVLFVDLRGYDKNRPPAEPAAARQELLRALGRDVGVRRLSAAEQRRELVEALRLGSCVLILDDAGSAAQVRDVVGAADPPCFVLVTSRHRLDDLGGDRIALGPLPADAAVAMLGGSGYPIADVDVAAAEEVAALLGHHPLALELTARRLVERREWPMAEHAAAIRGQQDLLHLPLPVSASLDASLHALDAPSGVALRLIAEQPCGRLPRSAVGALLGADVGALDEVIDSLTSAHLVSERDDGLSVHDLVRLAARSWSLREDAPSAREAARVRLLEHYLSAAEEAVGEIGMLPYAAPAAAARPPAGPDATDRAWAWLSTERDNLLALADPRHAAALPVATTRMSSILGRYLEAQGHYPTAVVLHRWSVAVAGRRGDHGAEVDSRGFLAAALARLGETDEAMAEIDRVLAAGNVRETADAVVTAWNVRGVIAGQRGDLEGALADFRSALEVVETGRTVRSRTGLLGNIGAVLTYLGRIPEAIDHQQRALAQALEDEDWDLASAALTNLVDNHLANGAQELALEAARQACDLGERYGINTALVRTNLGVALTALGRYDEAREAHHRGLRTARGTGDPDAIATIHNNVGDTEAAAGDGGAARAAYAAALAAVAHADGIEAERARAGLAVTG